MGNTVTPLAISELPGFYSAPGLQSSWNLPFTLPEWLAAWWDTFGRDSQSLVVAVKNDDRLLGIAPLRVSSDTAVFIGSSDVCDYLDFIVADGRGTEFFNLLLAELAARGIRRLELESIRPDSSVIAYLIPLARGRSAHVSLEQADVTVELPLPKTWDEYLMRLDAKQRHEVRRKLRRLGEEGRINYRVIDEPSQVNRWMDTFLDLFERSREDKAQFMTPLMEQFFREMAENMSRAGFFRFGVMELNDRVTAMVLYFDFNNVAYLYNSGYEPQYRDLSVGVLSKALCIRDSIEKGRRLFDFLKGSEEYKHRLGGQEVPVYRCRIEMGAARE